MALSIQTQVTDLTITITVSGGGSAITATIGNVIPARVPVSGTPMVLVEGTTNIFTFDVPEPGTFNITVISGSESVTVPVVVPPP